MHILIIPKEHIESVKELKEEHKNLTGEMILTAQKIAREKGLEGYKLVFNVGREGGASCGSFAFTSFKRRRSNLI